MIYNTKSASCFDSFWFGQVFICNQYNCLGVGYLLNEQIISMSKIEFQEEIVISN